MAVRKLLVIDTSFSYQAILERGLKRSVTCRDLDGFFEHVWSVHPFASIVTTSEWAPKYGSPISYSTSAKHTFIEGKLGRFCFLKRLPTINFLISQIGLIFFLISLIRREDISVIRVGDPLYLGLLGFGLSKLTGIPFVVRVGSNNEKIRLTTGMGIMPRFFKSINQERMVERFVLSRANLVAGANLDNLQFAIENGALQANCTLFRYGNLIDSVHYIDPKVRPVANEIFTDGMFLLCIARLELVKKVDDVVRVLAQVRSAGFDIKALLVGDGRERDKLELLAHDLGVFDHLIFCGNRDQLWLSCTISKASVVVSPHTGRALTEAALGGAPIAAYEIDWQSELIETGLTGEMVPYGDWKALARSTIKLLSDSHYALSMGDNARAKVLEMMNPEKLNQHERNQYTRLLKNFN